MTIETETKIVGFIRIAEAFFGQKADIFAFLDGDAFGTMENTTPDVASAFELPG